MNDSDSEVAQKIDINEIQVPPKDANRELKTILRLCLLECSSTTGNRIIDWARGCNFPLK